MVAGFFGCCGAIRESKCRLVLFFINMLIPFLALVAGGVACLAYKSELPEIALQAFQDSFDLYTDDDPQSLVDLVQRIFSCCGVNSYADYINKGVQIPFSCKSDNTTDVTELEGCSVAVPEKLNEKFVIITGGIALGAGAAMSIGLVFSMMLCCAIRIRNRNL
ncbi:CD9 [Bugula neritina]|uniref:CD9 n=1 Tax=Bugula neritina TaxID=10212 RepID=A0A7J7KQN0_BUGNE|nr:CD9 [Bugula neritina]